MQSLGKPLNRVDGRAKVTGKATFSAEHKIPHVAHAVMLMSAIPKGRITAMDTRAAEQLPGVLAIMTYKNTPKLPEKPKGEEAGRPADRKLQLLQNETVLYANQPIAVAVAETLETAKEAAALIRVTYASQPHSIHLWRGLARAYKPEKGDAHGEPPDSSRGDVADGLTKSDVKIQHVYTTPFETHNPMEMHV